MILTCFDMLSHIRIKEQTQRRQNNCKWQLKQSPIDVTDVVMYIDASASHIFISFYIYKTSHATVLKASCTLADIHICTLILCCIQSDIMSFNVKKKIKCLRGTVIYSYFDEPAILPIYTFYIDFIFYYTKWYVECGLFRMIYETIYVN